MDFTVSALSFVGPKMKWMAQLPKDMGIEIFWEYGSEDYWKQMLPKEAVRSASTDRLSAKIFLRLEIRKQLWNGCAGPLMSITGFIADFMCCIPTEKCRRT